MKSFFSVFALLVLATSTSASAGLIVHAQEFGVGKFHRGDNQAHPYGSSHAWAPYVLSAGASMGSSATGSLVTDNADGSVSVAFTTLEDLMIAVEKLSASRSEKIDVLNMHGHGVPGGMWFPKDQSFLDSIVCARWRQSAAASDSQNMHDYYSAVTKGDVESIREMSKEAHAPRMSCITGLSDWEDLLSRHAKFKAAFAPDARLRFLSCVVGLGNAGEAFVRGVAAKLFVSGSSARVESTTFFGLGDWSMNQGMGFWDYQSDEQIKYDNKYYPINRKDSEFAQKGVIRVTRSEQGRWSSFLYDGQSIMTLGRETADERGGQGRPALLDQLFSDSGAGDGRGEYSATRATPQRIRVPGTTAYVTRLP
jgi:hypothetical protein